MQISRWFGYVLLIGVLPIVLRLVAHALFDGSTDVAAWSVTDVCSFGFLVAATSFSMLEQCKSSSHDTIHYVVIFIFLVFLGAFFFLDTAEDALEGLLNELLLLQSSVALSVVLLIQSFLIAIRCNKPIMQTPTHEESGVSQ